MKVKELIEKLQALPQNARVIAVSEYDEYTEVRFADFVENDDYNNGAHVQLTEYGLPADRQLELDVE